ncbi:MAG: elongation factor P [Archangium sp.]
MANVIDTSEFKNGMKIEMDGEPYVILEFQHVKPGKGSAFTRTTMRSLLSGRNLERTFKSGDKVDRPDIEERDMQFLYAQGDEFHFMDQRNYEQTYIDAKVLGEAKNYLKENIQAAIMFYNGKAIGVTLPNSVELKVTKCDPGVRGDTVSGAQKPATLETGYVINVPLFINEGDVLKIDTRSGEYLTRTSVA